MAIARKCDRCGNLYEMYTRSYKHENVNSIRFEDHARGDTHIPKLWFDLCKDCMTELVDWIDQGKSICRED